MGKISRVVVIGASGVGKTTLAKHISETYGLPFISASAREVWGRFGFTSHADALSKCLKDPGLGLQYQEHVFINRMNALSKAERFVTDRSPVDNYTYFLLQQAYVSEDQNRYMKSICLEEYKRIEGVIFIRSRDVKIIEDNKRRIVNKTYQDLVDNVMEMVLCKTFQVETSTKEMMQLWGWDLEQKKRIITDLFTE